LHIGGRDGAPEEKKMTRLQVRDVNAQEPAKVRGGIKLLDSVLRSAKRMGK